jgi:glycosyltransferase involved in cell wall biosynthesis
VLRAYRSPRSILIIVQNLPVPLDRRVWQEANTLRRAGFRVAVICPKSKTYTKSYERLEGVDIYRYPLLIEADDSVVGYFLEFLYCWCVTLWLALRAYRRRPFQVIQACNPPDTYFAIALLFRPLGVKFIFDHHDLCPDLYVSKGHVRRGVVYSMLLFLERLTFRTADMVIASNESYRQVAKTRGGVPDRKIVVVRSGPRREWAQLCGPNAELKQGRKYLVVFLGQIGKQDGVDYLLRAICIYRLYYGNDTLFTIIGGGPSQPDMRRLGAGLGVSDCVRFTGRVSDELLCSYLRTADVCVDPDPWTEFTNVCTMNKIIEYMSVGKPIIAFDLLEHRRSAQEAAYYIEPNDVTKFAMGIRELLEDEPRRERMSKFAKHRFQHALAWEVSEESLLRAYNKLLEENNFSDCQYDQTPRIPAGCGTQS